MQNTLLAIGFALIAAIVAALVGPWLIDWNRHKAFFEAEASQRLGAPVTIGGDLSVRLLPSVSIDARDVTIGAAGHPTRIGRIQGELRVAPLIRGEAVLTNLLVRDADVTWSGGQGPGRLLTADDISIENARLAVLDANGTSRLIGERMMLRGESRGVRGPLRLEGRMGAQGRTVAVHVMGSLTDQGPIVLRVRAQDEDGGLGLEAEGQIAQGTAPRFEGQVILTGAAGRLPWRIAGTGAATPESLLIDKADATLGQGDRTARGAGTLRLGFGDNPTAEAILTARQIDLDRLIEAPDATPRTPREVLAALARTMPLLAEGTALPITLGLDINGLMIGGAQVIDLRGDLTSGAGGWTAERLAARLPGDSAVEASGRIAFLPDLAFAGALSLQASRPGVLMSWLDTLPTPQGTLDDPIRIATTIVAEPGRLVLDKLEARTAAGEARGRIALDVPALGRHALALDLTAGTLDLDVIMRLARGAGARLDPATDTRLKLRANEATIAGLAARGLDLTLVSDGRVFDAERLRIDDLAGVGLDLSGRLDGLGGPLSGRLAGRLTAANAEGLIGLLARNDRTAPLARLLTERAGVLGRTDLSIAFEAGANRALRLRGAGRIGEANVHLDATGTGDVGDPASLAGNAALVVEAPTADSALTLLTGLLPASAAPATPTRFELVVDRAADGSAEARGEIEAAGALLGFGGRQAATGERSGILRLAASDLAPLLPLVGVPSDLAGRLPAEAVAEIAATGEGWRATIASGSVNRVPVTADLTGRGLAIDGKASIAAVSLDALASALMGPAFLVETEAGGFADAAFGRAPFDGLEGRLALSIGSLGLGGYPPVTGMETEIRRSGSRTEVRDLVGQIAGARLAGRLMMDRSRLATLVSGEVKASEVPLALLLPGGRAPADLALNLTGSGTSPASLVASLRGEGRLDAAAGPAVGFDVTALQRITREAERAQDRGRPIGDAAFASRLGEELAKPVDLPPLTAALSISGATVRLSEVTMPVGRGAVSWSASVDLAAGTLAGSARVVSEPVGRAEALPLIVVRLGGALGRPERALDSDDVAGWLALRLVERAGVAIEMTEGDRIERLRQRLFSRYSSRPLPTVEVPLPEPVGLAPELLAPVTEPAPPPAVSPAEPAVSVAPSETAPVPQPRPSEGRPNPRSPSAGQTSQPAGPPMDLPSVVRRALDQQSRSPAPPAGAPMSILPALPPPVEVGPAPGMRR